MKIGAKEMKRAYKDVKLDQIDVCTLHCFGYHAADISFFPFLYKHKHFKYVSISCP